MHLKKVTLNNYRCFRSLEVELHPRLTVLVGGNGAGKTAVLDGIAAGLSPILKYASSANQRLSGAGVDISNTDFRLRSKSTQSHGEFREASEFVHIVMETATELKWDLYQSSRVSKKPSDRIGQRHLAQYIEQILDSFISEAPKLLPVFAYYGAQRSYIEYPEPVPHAAANYSYPTSALVGCLDSSNSFKDMLNWFDIEEVSELRASRANPQGSGHSLALEAARQAVAVLLGETYKNPHFDEDHKFLLESVEDGKLLEISQLSQGYQRMLSLSMDFSRRLALSGKVLSAYIYDQANPLWTVYQNPLTTEAIMLVDEIDLHLHPTWQQRVLGDLMRAFPETQFIVTTHSPQVLTTVYQENVRIIRNGQNPDTGEEEYWLETPTQQTRGVSNADVLASIMGVDPVPAVPEAAWLSQYRALIQQGLHDSSDGTTLKNKLIHHFGDRHPEMLDCERMIRLEAFKRSLPPKPTANR